MAAEMERDLIRERTLDGLAAAHAQGRRGGRRCALDADTLAVAVTRHARGESAIAQHLGIGRSTLYRELGEPQPTSDRPTNAAYRRNHPVPLRLRPPSKVRTIAGWGSPIAHLCLPVGEAGAMDPLTQAVWFTRQRTTLRHLRGLLEGLERQGALDYAEVRIMTVGGDEGDKQGVFFPKELITSIVGSPREVLPSGDWIITRG